MKGTMALVIIAVLVGGTFGFYLNNGSNESNIVDTESLQLLEQINELNQKVDNLENIIEELEQAESLQNDDAIPSSIISSANQKIIELVGESNFNNIYNYKVGYFISNNPNPGESPFYNLRYEIKDLDFSFLVHVSEEGVVDLTGGTNFVQIPNCVENQDKCDYITKSRSIEIANENGFEGDESTWSVSSTWSSQTNSYTWRIFSNIEKPHPEYGGACFIHSFIQIDANTGEIIEEGFDSFCP